MDLDSYIRTILASTPDDWERIFEPDIGDGHDRLMVLKTDLNISIALGQKHWTILKNRGLRIFPISARPRTLLTCSGWAGQ